MKNTLFKDQKGFSHHIIFPLLAILLVAGIGGFVMLRSSSASISHKVICANNVKVGSTWKTCGTSYLKYYNGHTISAKFQVNVVKNSDGSRTLHVVANKNIYKFDSGKTTVKADIINVSATKMRYVSCNNKNSSRSPDVHYWGSGDASMSTRLYADAYKCFIWFRPTIIQTGPVSGYINKTQTNGPDDVRVTIRV